MVGGQEDSWILGPPLDLHTTYKMRTFKYGVRERSVVALVRVGRLDCDYLDARRLLFADRHHILLRVHDDGRVVVDVGYSHLDLHTFATTSDPSILVPGLNDYLMPGSGFSVQWFLGAQFT